MDIMNWYMNNRGKWLHTHSALTAHLVEHTIGNLTVAILSTGLDTGRHGPPIHQAQKWVPSIWTKLPSWLFN